jgi:hypothetical protein
MLVLCHLGRGRLGGRELIARDHPEEGRRYLADGTLEGMDELLADEDEDAPQPGRSMGCSST